MTTEQLIQKAINALEDKNKRVGLNGFAERQQKLRVLKYGPCPGCSHFDLRIDPARGRGTGISLLCKRGIDPKLFYPDDWIPLDGYPTCTTRRER